MEINHQDNGKQGKFYIEEGQVLLAEMSYQWESPSVITIDHTYVGEQLKGQGVGKLLLQEVVTFAKTNKLRIIPVCPFAKSTFDKTPALQDVL